MIRHWMIKLRLKEFLEEKGVSIYRLAKETGVAFQALQKIRDQEVTNIKFDTLDKICFVLECTPSDLITYRRGLYVMPDPDESDEGPQSTRTARSTHRSAANAKKKPRKKS